MTETLAITSRPPPPLMNGAAVAPAMAALVATQTAPGLPPIRAYPLETRETVRRLVESTTMTLKAISAKTGVSATTIRNWIDLYGWQRPEGAPPLGGRRAALDAATRGARLATRLYRALGHQLAAIERRTGGKGDEPIEKDARTLGLLAKTLETLIGLDRGDGTSRKEPEPTNRADLRLELARRIAAWAEQGGEPAPPDRPAAGPTG